uniref:Uncharacterized protein n=1 Tax=Anguilla anguilla TaxID=7936 RepID=A0A0E9TAW9_ANGAN
MNTVSFSCLHPKMEQKGIGSIQALLFSVLPTLTGLTPVVLSPGSGEPLCMPAFFPSGNCNSGSITEP